MSPKTENSQARDEISGFVRELMLTDQLPGVSIALFDSDGPTYAEGFGARNLSTNEPATEHTLYGFGSCTKSIVAFAIQKLASEDRLSVKDPVDRYIDFRLGSETNSITIHHLLSHTSGIPSLGESIITLGREMNAAEVNTTPFSDFQDLHDHINEARWEVAAIPGEKCMYLNSGYILLAEIIEAVADKPFIEYIDEIIFSELDMQKSTFSKSALTATEDVSTPYLPDDPPSPTNYGTHELGYGPGGLLSSVLEMAEYARLLMNGGTTGSDVILQEDYVKELFKPQAEYKPGRAYAYGLLVEEYIEDTLIGHSGSLIGSSAYFGFLKNNQKGVVVASNTSPAYTLSIVGKGILSCDLNRDWKDDVAYFKRRRRLEELVGSYESYKGLQTADIERFGGMLMLNYSGSETYRPLIPKNEDIDGYEFYTLFEESGKQEEVEFMVEDDEVKLQIDRWLLHKVD